MRLAGINMKLADCHSIKFKPGDIVAGVEGVALYIMKGAVVWHVKDGNLLLVLKCVWSSLENIDMVYVVDLETKVEGWAKSFDLKNVFQE